MKRGWLAFILIFAIYVSLPLVIACEGKSVPQVIIQCNNEHALTDNYCLNPDCSIKTAKISDGKFAVRTSALFGDVIAKKGSYTILVNSRYNIAGLNDIVSVLDKACVEDSSQLKMFFQVEGVEVEDYLVFIPRIEEHEIVLQMQKNNLMQCEYLEYEKIGNWYSLRPKVRPYCYFDLVLDECGEKTYLSYTSMFGHLTSRPKGPNLTYLAGFLLMAGSIAFLFTYLFRNGHIGSFLSLNMMKGIFTALFAAAVFFSILNGKMNGTLYETTVILTVLFYLLASLFHHSYSRRNAKPYRY